MMDQEDRIANLEQAMHQMAANYWRIQGRINALEIIAGQAILDYANLANNPFEWIQTYVKSMETTRKSLIPDVDDQPKGERLREETVIAIDEFLETLLGQSDRLKGAPS